MNREDYDKLFKDNGKKEKALERAWHNRDFEIEFYWKRASYFWTFIAATFVGYLTLISSNNYNTNLKTVFPQIEYIILCLGLVFSIAWILVNIGSKHWFENWETHIDLLEDSITGPIYKVVRKELSFSVTKINLFISIFVTLIWLTLIVRYLFYNNILNFYWILITLLTLAVIILMICKIGRTKTSNKEYKLYQREFTVVEI